MLVEKKGSRYLLEGFENKNELQPIQFIEKISKKEYIEILKKQNLSEDDITKHLRERKIWHLPDVALITLSDGTTNEDVVKMIIDRLESLQAKAPCKENNMAIIKFKEGLMWLEERIASKKRRQEIN